jgi:hypothetical protein
MKKPKVDILVTLSLYQDSWKWAGAAKIGVTPAPYIQQRRYAVYPAKHTSKLRACVITITGDE